MSKILTLILLLSFGFSSNNNVTSYHIDFEEELKVLTINAEIENPNLSDELNNQYYIDSDFLYELGIKPFSTLYMVEDD